MLIRLMCRAVPALISTLVLAAPGPHEDDRVERYGDLQHCMGRTLGKQWQERFRVELTVNRLGAIEATGASIDSAPEAVRLTDLRCRREVHLAGQPRP